MNEYEYQYRSTTAGSRGGDGRRSSRASHDEFAHPTATLRAARHDRVRLRVRASARTPSAPSNANDLRRQADHAARWNHPGGGDGGHPTETEIGRRLFAASPIRAIAGIRQVSTSVYKKPFAITGAATGWVGETAARPETTAPTLAELQFPTMELYAMPAQDSGF